MPPEAQSGDVRNRFNEGYSPVIRKVVRALSYNSRISISELAKTLDVSRRTAAQYLKKAEESLGVDYLLEINEHALGLTSPHIIDVKFERKPDYEHIKALLERSYIPQVAATVKGKFDMFIYANALSGKDYAHWDKHMQIALAEFDVSWRASEVAHKQLGFFPLRNGIIERASIPEKYKRLLVELNGNSRISFQELSHKLNMNFNTVAYTFKNLVKTNYVDRFTVSLKPQKGVSVSTFLSKYIPSSGYESASAQARIAVMSDEDNPVINKYLVTAPLIGSHDLFALCAFDDFDSAYEHAIAYHRKLFRKYKVKMVYGEVDRVLVGRLPLRSIDVRQEFKHIAWEPDMT